MSADRVPLTASLPVRPGGSPGCDDPLSSQPVEATIVVRRQAAAPELDGLPGGAARPMSREEAVRALGADPRHLQLVEQFVRAHGLEVTASSAPERSVRIVGTVARMEAAFGVKLRQSRSGGRCYLCYDGPLMIPASLAGTIEGVLGLDQRPIAELR